MTPTLQDFKAELFRSIAHPVRIRILELLRGAGSLTVREIQQRLGVEPSNVSQHLAIMRGRGLLSTRREGTSIWYSVAEPQLYAMLDAARAIFDNQLAANAKLAESAAPVNMTGAERG